MTEETPATRATLPLPKEVAVDNLNKLEWIAVPYHTPEGAKSALSPEYAYTGYQASDTETSTGFGYYLVAHVPEKYKTARSLDVMLGSLHDIGVGTSGWLNHTQSASIAARGYIGSDSTKEIRVHGREEIMAMVKAGVNAPLPDKFKKEIKTLSRRAENPGPVGEI